MLSNYKEDERKGRHELWSRHSVSINCQVAAFDMTTIKPRAKESGSVWPTNYCLGNCQRHSLGFPTQTPPPTEGMPQKLAVQNANHHMAFIVCETIGLPN